MKLLKNIYLIIKKMGLRYFLGVIQLYRSERAVYLNFAECLEDEVFYNGLKE